MLVITGYHWETAAVEEMVGKKLAQELPVAMAASAGHPSDSR